MAKTFQNDNEKMSYAMGLHMAEYVANAPVGLTPDLVLEGLKDALAGNPGIPPEEYAGAMRMLQTRMRDAARDQAQNAGEAHAKAGKEFLAANKAKAGVSTSRYRYDWTLNLKRRLTAKSLRPLWELYH